MNGKLTKAAHILNGVAVASLIAWAGYVLAFLFSPTRPSIFDLFMAFIMLGISSATGNWGVYLKSIDEEPTNAGQ